jgi:hypothetical protein
MQKLWLKRDTVRKLEDEELASVLGGAETRIDDTSGPDTTPC